MLQEGTKISGQSYTSRGRSLGVIEMMGNAQCLGKDYIHSLIPFHHETNVSRLHHFLSQFAAVGYKSEVENYLLTSFTDSE